MTFDHIVTLLPKFFAGALHITLPALIIRIFGAIAVYFMVKEGWFETVADRSASSSSYTRFRTSNACAVEKCTRFERYWCARHRLGHFEAGVSSWWSYGFEMTAVWISGTLHQKWPNDGCKYFFLNALGCTGSEEMRKNIIEIIYSSAECILDRFSRIFSLPEVVKRSFTRSTTL